MKLLTYFAIIFLMISVPHLSYAEDENTLFYYSRMTTNTEKYSLNDLDKITFTDNSIQMWERSGLIEINFEDFLLFTFKEIEHPYVSSVEPIPTSHDDLIYIVVKCRMVNIESRLPLSGIVIYDLQGRIVVKDNMPATSYHFMLSSVPTGVYIVKAVCDGKAIIKKIILHI